jgi:hypothetical protein
MARQSHQSQNPERLKIDVEELTAFAGLRGFAELRGIIRATSSPRSRSGSAMRMFRRRGSVTGGEDATSGQPDISGQILRVLEDDRKAASNKQN